MSPLFQGGAVGIFSLGGEVRGSAFFRMKYEPYFNYFTSQLGKNISDRVHRGSL